MSENDNKSSRGAVGSLLTGCGAGFFLAVCILLMYFTTGDAGAVMTLAVMLAVILALFLAATVFVGFVQPFFRRRRAALRALGKHGIVKVMRDSTAKYAYKGVLCLLSDKFSKAEEYLNIALSRTDIRQNQMFCIEWLIKLYEACDNAPKTLWCFRKAAEYAPDNPEVMSRLGHAYYVDGHLDKALYCFEQALRYDPNNGYSYYSIAKIQMIRGEDDKAVETLQKLTKINENHPLVYAELAIISAMHGEREKSAEYFKKAQFCGFDNPELLNKRITAILDFGKAEDAGGEYLPGEYYRHTEKSEAPAEEADAAAEKD